MTRETTLQQRVQRFVNINNIVREATLESERDFLKVAGNISSAQLQLILTIGSHPNSTMSDIAKIMHFSKANVSQMIDRLLIKKFVKRQRSNTDKRVVFVELLAKGKKVCQLHQQHVERTALNWFSLMTEQEQEQMLNFFEKIAAPKEGQKNDQTN